MGLEDRDIRASRFVPPSTPVVKPNPYKEMATGLKSAGFVGGNLSGYVKPPSTGGSGSGYTGGSYAGGSSSGGTSSGTTTTTTAPATPASNLEEDALKAALARISAEYGIRIAEPQNQLDAMGGRYLDALLQNQRDRQGAQRGVNNTMLERGIYNSGIRREEMGRAVTPIEEERGKIHSQLAYGKGVDESDYGTQAIQLQSAVEQLKAAQANAELERRIQAEQGGLSHDLAMATGG